MSNDVDFDCTFPNNEIPKAEDIDKLVNRLTGDVHEPVEYFAPLWDVLPRGDELRVPREGGPEELKQEALSILWSWEQGEVPAPPRTLYGEIYKGIEGTTNLAEIGQVFLEKGSPNMSPGEFIRLEYEDWVQQRHFEEAVVAAALSLKQCRPLLNICEDVLQMTHQELRDHLDGLRG